MSSEIRVNSLSSRAGLSTVTLTDTGPIFSGITTFQDSTGFNVGTGGSIFSPESNTIALGTNSAERLRIKSDGKIGIGEGTPLGKLHIKTGDSGASSVEASADELVIEGSGNSGVTILSSTTGEGLLNFGDSSDVNVGSIVYNHSTNSMQVKTADVERLSIKSTGDFHIAWNDGQFVGQYYDANYYMGLTFGSNNRELYIDNRANDTRADIVFRTVLGQSTPVERLRIASDGNIGVGGATGTDYSLLDGIVTNTANGSAGLLINSSSSSHNAYLGFSYGSGSSTSHADQFSAYIGRVGDNTLILGTNNNIRVRIDPSGHLLHGVSADEDTSGNGGLRFINSGDIQIDGDQKALVFRSTNNTAQLQSAIEWWNENGAGVQSKIACDRTAVSQAPSDLVFYTSPNVDSGGTSSDGDIAEHLRITSAGETLISNNANRFLSLDRTNVTSGSGEFNLNVENTSQATVSYDDGAPLVIGTSSSPRTQAGFSEKVRISSEGYVTKANHPVFRVGRHTDYNHTALQPVQFNVTTGSAHINQGNHYSTSLHRFTAPVAGVYQFSACVIVNGLANPTDVTDLFYLMKNGGNVAYSMRRSRYVSNYTGTSGYYVDFMSNVNVLMAANDFCDIRVRLSLSVHGNATYTWFTGTLVG